MGKRDKRILPPPKPDMSSTEYILSRAHMPEFILLFDQINIARCATDRAMANHRNRERFNGEYDTAKMWSRRSTTCYR
jgi:hypothetical protein